MKLISLSNLKNIKLSLDIKNKLLIILFEELFIDLNSSIELINNSYTIFEFKKPLSFSFKNQT